MSDPVHVVSVEIHGQQYPIRSGLDPAYVAELAMYVNEKMRLAIMETPSGDTLKIAVLAALNIADEFFRAQDEGRRNQDSIAQRAEQLERMLDLALDYGNDNAQALEIKSRTITSTAAPV
jgi:cell division protein ZapA